MGENIFRVPLPSRKRLTARPPPAKGGRGLRCHSPAVFLPVQGSLMQFFRYSVGSRPKWRLNAVEKRLWLS